jgi:hypothetical protein
MLNTHTRHQMGDPSSHLSPIWHTFLWISCYLSNACARVGCCTMICKFFLLVSLSSCAHANLRNFLGYEFLFAFLVYLCVCKHRYIIKPWCIEKIWVMHCWGEWIIDDKHVEVLLVKEVLNFLMYLLPLLLTISPHPKHDSQT